MKRIDVVKKGDGWAGESGGRTVSNTKAETVRKTVAVAKQGSEPVSVRIHGVDGKIQEERTYPRSADPRRRKGYQLARRPGRETARPSQFRLTEPKAGQWANDPGLPCRSRVPLVRLRRSPKRAGVADRATGPLACRSAAR